MTVTRRKFEKHEVQYGRATMEDSRCDHCRFFHAVSGLSYGECSLVKGVIYPQDWCREFSRRKDA